MKKVGIIDDGISALISREVSQWERNKDAWTALSGELISADSHGSCIAEIIKSYHPDVMFSGLKVLNSSGWGNLEIWLEAVKKTQMMDVRIWNISNGTVDFFQFDKIKNCMENIVDSGVLFVAARNNRNIFTLPACLRCIIGVAFDETLERNTLMVNPVVENDINIRANLDFPVENSCRLAGIRRDYNSYQTAAVTGILAKRNLSFYGRREREYFFNHIAEYLQPGTRDRYRLVPWLEEKFSRTGELLIPAIYIKGNRDCFSWCRALAGYFREKGSYTILAMDYRIQPLEDYDALDIWEEVRRNDEKSWLETWNRIYHKHRCDLIISLSSEKEEGLYTDMFIDYCARRTWIEEEGTSGFDILIGKEPGKWEAGFEQIYHGFDTSAETYD